MPMLLALSTALASQIVCPSPGAVWPPPDTVLPTNATVHIETREALSAATFVLSDGRRIPAEIDTLSGQQGRPSWNTLKPTDPLPPGVTVQVEYDSGRRASRGKAEAPATLQWRVGSAPDLEAPVWKGEPTVVARQNELHRVTDRRTSAYGLAWYEQCADVAVAAQDPGPLLVIVHTEGMFGGTAYPVVVTDGVARIGRDECYQPLPLLEPGSAGDQVKLELMDLGGNVSTPSAALWLSVLERGLPVDTPPALPPPRITATAEPDGAGTRVCWTLPPTVDPATIVVAPPSGRAVRADGTQRCVALRTTDTGNISVEVTDTAGKKLRAEAAPTGTTVGVALRPADATDRVQGLTVAPDGALWVSTFAPDRGAQTVRVEPPTGVRTALLRGDRPFGVVRGEVHVARDGTWWTLDGCEVVFRPPGEALWRVIPQARIPSCTSAIAVAPNRDVWVVGADGVRRIDPKGRVTRVATESGAKAVAVDARGRVYLASQRAVVVVEGRGGRYTARPVDLPERAVVNRLRDLGGRLVVVGAVGVVDLETGRTLNTSNALDVVRAPDGQDYVLGAAYILAPPPSAEIAPTFSADRRAGRCYSGLAGRARSSSRQACGVRMSSGSSRRRRAAWFM